MKLRALRRDRAARLGPEMFIHERAFDDCLDRLGQMRKRFARALLVGCPDPGWPESLRAIADQVDGCDPGPLFARRASLETVIEDAWSPSEHRYDLVLAVGTLDTVNDLAFALRLLRHGMRGDALLMAVFAGGETLPMLRSAMRAADAASGIAAPHVHPRIEASALPVLLSEAGFIQPVIDIDRVAVSYPDLRDLVSDLRRMAATNLLRSRPGFIGRASREAAITAFAAAGDGERTMETFELVHLAAWTPADG